jgi:hypothetical protein
MPYYTSGSGTDGYYIGSIARKNERIVYADKKYIDSYTSYCEFMEINSDSDIFSYTFYDSIKFICGCIKKIIK